MLSLENNVLGMPSDQIVPMQNKTTFTMGTLSNGTYVPTVNKTIYWHMISGKDLVESRVFEAGGDTVGYISYIWEHPSTSMQLETICEIYDNFLAKGVTRIIIDF